MNCSEAESLVPLYLTGELEAAQADPFAAHLRQCHACASGLAEYTRLDASLRAAILADHPDTTALDRRVLQQIGMESRETPGSSWRWIFATAGLALMLLAAVAGYRLISPARITNVYQAAARDHHIELVDLQPRRWKTDLAAISELAAKQGIAAPVISGLAPAGYRLEQGKLCLLHGRIFLHLVYSDGQRNFSLFLGHDDEGSVGTRRTQASGTEIYSADRGAEHVAGFERGKLRALVVSGESRETALSLATFTARNI